MTPELFPSDLGATGPGVERVSLGEGAVLLRGAALAAANELAAAVERIAARAPFRRMVTPGGFTMSVAMTNCGDCGWVTDRDGYRYAKVDPLSGHKWPAMPDVLLHCATTAAAEAGFRGFEPDACLVNRYEPGARLSLHQDRDERDLTQPVVSISLGLPAIFQFGGLTRPDPLRKVPLVHGDVVVWGGPARLRYHGVPALKDGEHPLLGRQRINFTLRRAL